MRSQVTSGPTSPTVLGLDVDAVSRWVAAAGVGLVPPYRIAPVGQGRSNLTFVLTDDAGRSAVLRRPPLGHLLASAHDLGREMAFLRLLSAQELPVPQVLASCEDSSITGAPFYVMSHVAGTVLDTADVVERTVGPIARAATGPSLARALVRLHDARFDDDAFRRVVTTDGRFHAERQVDRWTKQWARSKPYDVPLIDDVARRLAAGVPVQREVTIVHGDYALHNAVFDADGEVSAILDWEMATLGDPQSDLAWLLMLWPDTTDDIVAGPEPVPLIPGFGPRERLIETYISASGREPTALPFWLALSYWKLTVAIAGIYQRWLSDPVNGGRGAEQLETEVVPLAEKAARAADEAGL